MDVHQQDTTLIDGRMPSQRLLELLVIYFPQYHLPEFQQMPINQSLEGLSSSNIITTARLKCRLEMFGIPMTTEQSFSDWESAKEATAKLALDVLEEFIRLVRCRTDEETFGQILSPVVRDLQAFQIPPKSSLHTSEAKLGAVGHEMNVRVMNEGDINKSRGEYLGPFLNGALNKIRYPELAPSAGTSAKQLVDAAPATVSSNVAAKESSSDPSADKVEDTNQENPICILHQHYQKRASHVAAPAFEHFGRARYWGAIGRYCGYEVTVRAVYLKRNDSKWEAARLLCQRVLGDLMSFREIPPDKIDDNDHGVVETKDVVVASSKAIVSEESNSSQILLTKPAGASTALGELDPSMIKEIPLGPLEQKGLAGRTFMAVFNEFIQKMHLPTPDFLFFNINQSLTRAYCCRMADFDGKPFMSYAFTRKQDAKEDCAGRAVVYMLEKRMIDDKGRPLIRRHFPGGDGRIGGGKRPALHHPMIPMPFMPPPPGIHMGSSFPPHMMPSSVFPGMPMMPPFFPPFMPHPDMGSSQQPPGMLVAPPSSNFRSYSNSSLHPKSSSHSHSHSQIHRWNSEPTRTVSSSRERHYNDRAPSPTSGRYIDERPSRRPRSPRD